MTVVEHGVNLGTAFDKAPVCNLREVLFLFIAQACARRVHVGAEVSTYVSKMGVKDAVRRFHIERDKAPTGTFLYDVVVAYIVADFRWR